MDEFERLLGRFQAGQMSQEDLASWIESNLSGTDRNSAYNRMMSDFSSWTPAPGAAAGAGLRSLAGVVNRFGNVGIGAASTGATGALGGGDDAPEQATSEQVISELEGRYGPLTPEVRSAVAEMVAQLPPEETVENIVANISSALEGAGAETTMSQALNSVMDAYQGETAPGVAVEAELPDAWGEMSDAEKLRFTAMELLAEGLRNPMMADFGQVANLLTTSQNIDLLDEGTVRLDDGTVITSDMLNHEDPVVAQQFNDAYNQRRQQIEQQAVDIFNAYQIDQHSIDVGASEREQNRVLSQFDAENTNFLNRFSLGQAEVNRVATEYDQLIRGLGESRARSENEINTMMGLMPYATGGKTSFTPSDLGAYSVYGSGLLGIGPDETVLNYPGSITIDPRQTQMQYDQSLGVGGRTINPLPGLGVGMGDIPNAPYLPQGPGAIQLQPPAAMGGGMPNMQQGPGPIQMTPQILQQYIMANSGMR